MVKNITSLTSSGLRDWLIQRVSAVIIAAYMAFILLYFVTHPKLSYDAWLALNQMQTVRIFTFLTLLSFMLHAWIGIWTVTTDYLKPLVIRLTAQILVIVGLFAMLAWGVAIIWSI